RHEKGGVLRLDSLCGRGIGQPAWRMAFERIFATGEFVELFPQSCAWSERGCDATDHFRHASPGRMGNRALQRRFLRAAVVVNAGDDSAHGPFPAPHGWFGRRSSGLWRR